MRTFRKCLSLSSTLIRCSTSQKLFSSCSSSLSYSDNLDSHNPLSESNPKSAVLNQFPEADDVEHTNTRIPISQNYQNPAFVPQSDVLNVLLRLKHEPLSALDYFKMAEKQPGFNAGVDCYCVLIHILAGHKVQRKLVNQWTSNHQCPDAGIVVDYLVSTADRFRN